MPPAESTDGEIIVGSKSRRNIRLRVEALLLLHEQNFIRLLFAGLTLLPVRPTNCRQTPNDRQSGRNKNTKCQEHPATIALKIRSRKDTAYHDDGRSHLDIVPDATTFLPVAKNLPEKPRLKQSLVEGRGRACKGVAAYKEKWSGGNIWKDHSYNTQ